MKLALACLLFLCTSAVVQGQAKYAGSYSGTARDEDCPRGIRASSYRMQINVKRDGKISGSISSGGYSISLSGRVSSDGKINARTSDGATASGKVKNGVASGTYRGNCKGTFRATKR